MAKLISLEGATVIWNDELNQSPFNENESFNINFSSNSNSYSRIIPYFGDGSYASTTLAYGYSDVYSYTNSNHGWYNASYKTIIISDGTDATNSDLIQWIQANAIITGGVWEEEKTPILIKNPITIFNKIEEYDGTIEVV